MGPVVSLCGCGVLTFVAHVARAGVVPVNRDSSVRAAIIGEQTNLVDTKHTSTFADFTDTASVFDDEHGSGNAFADQASKLTIVNGELRGFEVHGTATAGGPDADASGRFHLVFEVPEGDVWILNASGEGGGGRQSANGIGELLLVETTHNEAQLHFRSGEFPVDFEARSFIAPGRYDLLLTYGAGGFSGAQADLSGTFTNAAVPLPPAVWSGAATLAALIACWRRAGRSAVGERPRPA
jgi:hypothetical protein